MKTKRLTQLGLLTAAALILGYLEHLLPLFPGLPGVKLGLGNIVVLYALYRMDEKSALLLMLLKVVLCSLLFANAFSLLYALAGGACSLLAMALARRLPGVSVTGVSVVGALFHNLGQAAVACLLLGRAAVVSYLPVLLLAAIGTGLLTGIVAKGVLRALDVKKKDGDGV
ncbi:MAG: Gx transporter family protein [Clostridia bacterium]|nr:Gx transporter family protein [Clostridia bacterium]